MFEKKFISIIFLMTLIPITFSTRCYSIDIATLKLKAKTLNERLQKEIKDVTGDINVTSYMPNGAKINSKMTWYSKGVKTRTETETSFPNANGMSQKGVMIYDGKNLWQITPAGRVLVKGSNRQDTMFGKFWIELPDSAKVLGEENVNGHDCYKLLFPKEYTKSDDDVYWWLDKVSFVWVKVENKKDQMIGLMSDFRKVYSNLEMPYKTEVYAKGKLFSIMLVEKLEINKNLSDNLFSVDNIKDAPSMTSTMLTGTMNPAVNINVAKDNQYSQPVSTSSESSSKPQSSSSKEIGKKAVKSIFGSFVP